MNKKKHPSNSNSGIAKYFVSKKKNTVSPAPVEDYLPDMNSQNLTAKTYSKKIKSESVAEPIPALFSFGTEDLDDDDAFNFQRSRKTPKIDKENDPLNPEIKQIQTHLDFGQKQRGGLTQCNECKMEYIVGTEDNEHRKFHRMKMRENRIAQEPLVCKAEKIEEDWIVFQNETLQILRLNSEKLEKRTKRDYMKTKVETLKENLDVEMGNDTTQKSGSHIFLLITRKTDKLIGAAFAVKIQKAFRILRDKDSPTFQYETNSYQPATLGISRIWIHQDFRKRGFGKQLLETVVKSHFHSSSLGQKESIAFTQPTQEGYHLFKSFTQKEDFLVYDDTCL